MVALQSSVYKTFQVARATMDSGSSAKRTNEKCHTTPCHANEGRLSCDHWHDKEVVLMQLCCAVSSGNRLDL
jgi:hypothetical protein